MMRRNNLELSRFRPNNMVWNAIPMQANAIERIPDQEK
jgi:hypothetical protein